MVSLPWATNSGRVVFPEERRRQLDRLQVASGTGLQLDLSTPLVTSLAPISDLKSDISVFVWLRVAMLSSLGKIDAMAKVLVVDDDTSTTTLLRLLLELEGFEVDTSTSVPQAVAAAAEEIATFIIDCKLANGESGIELLRTIRRGETAARLDAPAILVSGDPRLEPAALEAGADAFLVKPYAPSHLTEMVRELIAGHH